MELFKEMLEDPDNTLKVFAVNDYFRESESIRIDKLSKSPKEFER